MHFAPLPTLLEIFGALMERQNSSPPPSNLSAYFLPLPPTYKYASAFPSSSRPSLSSALPLELSSEISVEMKLMRLEERGGEGGEEGSSAERGRRREDKLSFFSYPSLLTPIRRVGAFTDCTRSPSYVGHAGVVVCLFVCRECTARPLLASFIGSL